MIHGIAASLDVMFCGKRLDNLADEDRYATVAPVCDQSLRITCQECMIRAMNGAATAPFRNAWPLGEERSLGEKP